MSLRNAKEFKNYVIVSKTDDRSLFVSNWIGGGTCDKGEPLSAKKN